MEYDCLHKTSECLLAWDPSPGVKRINQAKLMHRANWTQMHSAIQLGAKTLCNIGVHSSRYQFIDELASPSLRIANVNRPVHNLPTPTAQKKPDGLLTPQGSTLRIRISLIIFQKLKKPTTKTKTNKHLF